MESLNIAAGFPEVMKRIESVRRDRAETDDAAVNKSAGRPHQFRERKGDRGRKLFVPIVSSEEREYFPVGLVDATVIPTNKAFFIDNGPLWSLAIISSRIHLAGSRQFVAGWRCAILTRTHSAGTRSLFRSLTEKNKADLTRCAEDILLAREAHFALTIADLYDPEKMPADLRAAHERNDEVLERIYIGRRFKNDTERLEKLFELYTKMNRAGHSRTRKRVHEADSREVPSVSVTYAANGRTAKTNALGMRPMQERVYERRGEQYLLIKSPPASGKSRALMFVALDKLANQGIKQAIIVVPEKSIGASFRDEPLSQFGFFADWTVVPKWNLCDAPGDEDGGKVNSVGAFLAGDDKVLICTHATFRFAVDRFGVGAFDGRLIAVDEFHHVSANPENKLGLHLGELISRDKVDIVAMTGSYFRGDADPVLSPQDEEKFDPVTYTYYEQLNGYEYLKQSRYRLLLLLRLLR